MKLHRIALSLICVLLLAVVALPLAGATAAAAPVKPAGDPEPDPSLYFYSGTDGHTRVPLSVYPDLLAVKFSPEVPPETARRILKRVKGVDLGAVDRLAPGANNFYWVPMAAGSTVSTAKQMAATLLRATQVVSAFPGFALAKRHVYGLTNELIVAFQPTQTPQAVAAILASNNLKVVDELDTALYTYVLKVKKSSSFTAQTMANHLIQTYGPSVIDYAHPNFVSPKKALVIPNDPLFNKQWHLHATGISPQFMVKPDADIDAPEAWDSSTGNPGIVIAVVDTGIDLQHPDLDLVAGTDVAGGSGSPGYQYPSIEKHSTAVSGMAAALGNNGLGVSGVCQSCKVMPIRFLAPGATLADEAQAFNFARIHGAHIINNSWGPVDNIQPVLPASTQTALQKCINEGRGGLGMPIFFASGNSGGPVPQNGYVNSPLTMAVGASTNQDKIASYSSRSANLDFVAPSGDGTASGGVWTTDITGLLGYAVSGDYTGGLAGTSFSSPQAAGLAALILDVNPALTWDQVRDVMRDTADMIDPSHSSWSGGFSTYFGHGKLNAEAALVAAANTMPPDPDSITKNFDWPNGSAVNVLPGATTFSPLQIPDTGTINSVKVNLSVNHPDPSDLRLKVKHPDGTKVTLWDELPGPVPSTIDVTAFDGKSLAGGWTFEAHAKSGGAAGTIVNLSMTINYTPPPPPLPTYGNGYPPQVIPDGTVAGLTQGTWITESGLIQSATLNLSITHPDVGDLRVTAVAPDGQQTTVHNQNLPGTANLNGSFPLTSFAGKNLHGSWQVIVQDLVAGTVGTLQDWTLTIDYTPDGCAPFGQWDSVDVPKSVPDNNPAGVASDVTVNMVGTVNNSTGIYVDLSHPNVGGDKISLILVHPDDEEEVLCGQIFPGFFLTCPYSGSGINALFIRSGALGKPMDGTWQLKVVDGQAGGGSATLNDWRLDLSYLPSGCGSVQSYSFASTDVPQSIPDQDFTGVRSDLEVDGASMVGVVADVNVTVDIAHGAIGDLRLYLISPQGVYGLLHNQTGGFTADLVTTYDTLTQSAHPLSIFKAKNPDGTWQLWAVDEGTGGTGTILGWSLEITTVTP